SALMPVAAALGVLTWRRPQLIAALFLWYVGIALADQGLAGRDRLASGLLPLLAAVVLGTVVYPPAARAVVVVLPILGLVALNRSFYSFFVRQRGAAFTVGLVLPMHVLYYLYSVLGFALA